jgi:DNA-binding GntR family transcriptional regulator
MTVFSIGRATRFTLRESVTDRLRTAIGEGTLAPGTHLAEVELSGSLGVSPRLGPAPYRQRGL